MAVGEPDYTRLTPCCCFCYNLVTIPFHLDFTDKFLILDKYIFFGNLYKYRITSWQMYSPSLVLKGYLAEFCLNMHFVNWGLIQWWPLLIHIALHGRAHLELTSGWIFDWFLANVWRSCCYTKNTSLQPNWPPNLDTTVPPCPCQNCNDPHYKCRHTW